MNWLIILLVLAGLVLVQRGLVARRATGIPWRPIRYDDTSQRELAKPLFSDYYRLTGKPDYVLHHGKALIPVEVKPTRYDHQPRSSDVLQLAAYCLLLEEHTQIAPPYGILRYAQQSFQIDWDDDLYEQLLVTLTAMRADRTAADVPRSHDDPRRCHACGFADRCADALK